MTEEQLLTVREAARACNRSEETVRRWIWSGRIRSRKLGNQHFIAPADLESLRSRLPRIGETRAKYETASVPAGHPLSDGKGGFDRDKVVTWWDETLTEIDEMNRGKPLRGPEAPSIADEIRSSHEDH